MKSPSQPSSPNAWRASRRRDFAALERRRQEAARLFARGMSRAQVGRTLGVSWQAAHNWFQAWQRGGKGGLKAAGRAGRKPRLSAEQLAQVERELLRGPIAHGYTTDLWTLPRIAHLIQKLTGERYHPGHVWKIMRRMGWTLQRPEQRARERDEEAIGRWLKRRWPQRKRGR